MLTEHVKLCAQYGIDVTKMTQVEVYVKLVERLLKINALQAAALDVWKSGMANKPGPSTPYEPPQVYDPQQGKMVKPGLRGRSNPA